MRGGVDEQGHLAGTLDFAGQQTLMVRAGTGDAAGDDLAAFGDEVAQDVRALVVQGQILVRAEAAELATVIYLNRMMRFPWKLCLAWD